MACQPQTAELTHDSDPKQPRTWTTNATAAPLLALDFQIVKDLTGVAPAFRH